MRVLVAGDTHGNLSHVHYLIRMAKERGIGVVFVVGDFGAWEHTPSGVGFFDDVDEAANEAGVTVYWLFGNHDNRALVERMYGDRVDDEGFLICRPNVRYALVGHRWTWNDVRFLAFGGAYSVDKEWRLSEERSRARLYSDGTTGHSPWQEVPPGQFTEATKGSLWFPEEEASIDEFERVLLDRSGVDVLLTHDKPDGSMPQGWTYRQPVECYRNQVRIQRIAESVTPTLLVHGHLHYPYEQDVALGPRAKVMRVVGLDCDQAMFYPDYTPLRSWLVLDLDPLDVDEQGVSAQQGESGRVWARLSSQVCGPGGLGHLAA